MSLVILKNEICLKCIDSIDKANFVESPVFLLRKLSFLKASGSSFPILELALVLTDDSINVKEKRIIHCTLLKALR